MITQKVIVLERKIENKNEENTVKTRLNFPLAVFICLFGSFVVFWFWSNWKDILWESSNHDGSFSLTNINNICNDDKWSLFSTEKLSGHRLTASGFLSHRFIQFMFIVKLKCNINCYDLMSILRNFFFVFH